MTGLFVPVYLVTLVILLMDASMLQSKMSIKSRDVIQHDVVGMRNVALVKMVSTSAVVSQDIGVLFLLVVFNVRLNSIVTRTKLAMK